MTGDSDIIVGLGKSCRLLGAAKRLTMEDIFSAVVTDFCARANLRPITHDRIFTYPNERANKNVVANFRGGTPLSDDCTVVDLMYSG